MLHNIVSMHYRYYPRDTDAASSIEDSNFYPENAASIEGSCSIQSQKPTRTKTTAAMAGSATRMRRTIVQKPTRTSNNTKVRVYENNDIDEQRRRQRMSDNEQHRDIIENISEFKFYKAAKLTFQPND